MNKSEIIDLARTRGFTLWATINGETLQFMDDRGINLFVEIDTGEFELRWNIPRTIFSIECPKCSPFSNKEHFNKIYRSFRQSVWIML